MVRRGKTMIAVILAISLLPYFAYAANKAFDNTDRIRIIRNEALYGQIYTQKVLVINFDPVFPMANNTYQHDLVSWWSDPYLLAEQYQQAMKQYSHSNTIYEIVEWNDINELPMAESGAGYSIEEYYQNLQTAINERWDYWGSSVWTNFGRLDYDYYMQLFNIYHRVAIGEIDEVWIFIGPCNGTDAYESIMIGKDAYFCNSPPMNRDDCPPFICYVFSYERDVGCMLEDAGHRMESIVGWAVFGSWDSSKPIEQMNEWELFTLYDKVSSGNAGCGNVHFAPNSEADYDWGNDMLVWSTCDDWLNYPDLTGEKTLVNSEDWGHGNMASHHEWWFSHIPHIQGMNSLSGKYNNWWLYFKYPEMKEDIIPLNSVLPGDGDANQDGNVDIMDLVKAIDFIVFGTNLYSVEDIDIDANTKIDIQDLSGIIDIIIGGKAAREAQTISTIAEGMVVINIPFSNTEPITVAEIAFDLSDGLSLVGVECSGMTGIGGDSKAVFFDLGGGVQSGTITLQVRLKDGVTEDQIVNVTAIEGANGNGIATVGKAQSYIVKADGSKPLSIITQPENTTAAEGTKASFTVNAAGGNAPLAYQWYINANAGLGWLAITGATADTYTDTVSAVNNGSRYFCRVSDAAGEQLDSSIVTLTVVQAPRTGDNAQPVFFLCLAVIAILAGAIILKKNMKKQHKT